MERISSDSRLADYDDYEQARCKTCRPRHRSCLPENLLLLRAIPKNTTVTRRPRATVKRRPWQECNGYSSVAKIKKYHTYLYCSGAATMTD